MADDVIEQTEPVAVAPPEPVAEPAPEPVPEPHPLEPGGRRFDEVYRDMKDARRDADEARRRVAELEQRMAQPAPQPQERFYTSQELQALVDAGKITPALMAEQISYQKTKELEHRLVQRQTEEGIKQAAAGEVQQYLSKMPDLTDTSSKAFREVSAEAHRIAEEMGKPVTDPRVQRLALRAVYGSVDKVVAVKQSRDFERKHADTYTETARGGAPNSGTKDPLKGIPPAYVEHWKRLNYSREQMLEEAKYIPAHKRS